MVRVRPDQRLAVERFGLGATDHDLEAAAADPIGWVVTQTRAPEPAVLNGPGVGSSRDALARNDAWRRERRRRQRDEEVENLEESRREMQQEARARFIDEMIARTEHAVLAEQPFNERLVWFYSNHFTVSQAGKNVIRGACTAFENEAIRPAVAETFADMLIRVVSHPVMLLYLDNAQSLGPASRIGKRRQSGLNENLAREILELHTLGVDGGYEQADVCALAKILTGWTVGSQRLARLGVPVGRFAFVEAMHEPGSHEVVGRWYANAGRKQGERVLEDLARHPSTARHIATKLVRHFVSDDPPAPLVRAVEAAFLETDGHLPSVHETLAESVFADPPQARKFKTPQELVVSSLRGLQRPPTGLMRRAVIEGLRTMNQMPFTAPSPAGWSDLQTFWSAPGALKQRIEWAIAVGSLAPLSTGELEHRAHVLLGEQASSTSSILRAPSPGQGTGLLLAAPEFQWR